MPEAEAQQRAVLARGEQGLEAFGGIHGSADHSRYHREREQSPGETSMLRMLRSRRPRSPSPSLPSPTPRRSARSPSACRPRSPRSTRTITTSRPTTSLLLHIFEPLIAARREPEAGAGARRRRGRRSTTSPGNSSCASNVKFHDGTPFTAEDVVATLQARAQRAQQPLVVSRPSPSRSSRRRSSIRYTHRLQDRGAARAAAERPRARSTSSRRRSPRRRPPRTSTPARPRSAPGPTSSSSTFPTSASC